MFYHKKFYRPCIGSDVMHGQLLIIKTLLFTAICPQISNYSTNRTKKNWVYDENASDKHQMVFDLVATTVLLAVGDEPIEPHGRSIFRLISDSGSHFLQIMHIKSHSQESQCQKKRPKLGLPRFGWTVKCDSFRFFLLFQLKLFNQSHNYELRSNGCSRHRRKLIPFHRHIEMANKIQLNLTETIKRIMWHRITGEPKAMVKIAIAYFFSIEIQANHSQIVYKCYLPVYYSNAVPCSIHFYVKRS